MAKPVLPRGLARERVIEAALSLFAEHGVKGTSLQMIADRLGISKAAVYYQFRSKDDIVLEVVRPVFDDIRRLVRIAETLPTGAQRGTAVSGLVELSVRHRRVTALFHNDPAVDELMHGRDEFAEPVERLSMLLDGPEPDTATRVAISMITAGIYGSATDPKLRDISDADLHSALIDCSQQMLRAISTHSG